MNHRTRAQADRLRRSVIVALLLVSACGGPEALPTTEAPAPAPTKTTAATTTTSATATTGPPSPGSALAECVESAGEFGRPSTGKRVLRSGWLVADHGGDCVGP